jgi:hypothetical protein
LASQLRHTLADPEMVALLMAVPQARRALQSVCRMLGIEAVVLTPTGVADVTAAIVEAPRGWPSLLPPAPPPLAPDFRYFRDGTPPQGPPSPGGV